MNKNKGEISQWRLLNDWLFSMNKCGPLNSQQLGITDKQISRISFNRDGIDAKSFIGLAPCSLLCHRNDSFAIFHILIRSFLNVMNACGRNFLIPFFHQSWTHVSYFVCCLVLGICQGYKSSLEYSVFCNDSSH